MSRVSRACSRPCRCEEALSAHGYWKSPAGRRPLSTVPMLFFLFLGTLQTLRLSSFFRNSGEIDLAKRAMRGPLVPSLFCVKSLLSSSTVLLP